jgi:hypothetical protein
MSEHQPKIFYPVPTPDRVADLAAEHFSQYSEKVEQGFTKVLLVPFGAPIEHLLQAYAKVAFEYSKDHRLIRGNERYEPRDAMSGSKLGAAWRPVLETLREAAHPKVAEHNDGVSYSANHYYPESYTEAGSESGAFKSDLTASSRLPGWQLLLVEDLPQLPGRGQGETIGGRQQFEATSEVDCDGYFQRLRERAAYRHEVPFTPETWLAYGLTHYVEAGKLIDSDAGGGATPTLLLGALPSRGWQLPGTVKSPWVAHNARISLPHRSQWAPGLRTAVRVA